MSELDLTLYSLYRAKGQEIPSLPGLLAQNPPRRVARGRENDRLLVYLTLTGNVPFSAEEYAQVAGKLAERFYQTSGSLTFALKTSVEALNGVLAERNMKTTGQGQYVIGMLVLAALRDSSLYVVQSGTTHVYFMGGESGLQHYHDLTMAGKGLGLSQTCRMYFAQIQVRPGDRLLFCAQHPPEWESALAEERGAASVEATRRRLFTVTQANLNAVLVGISDGNGDMRVMRLEPAPMMTPTVRPETNTPPARPAELATPAVTSVVKEEASPVKSDVANPPPSEVVSEPSFAVPLMADVPEPAYEASIPMEAEPSTPLTDDLPDNVASPVLAVEAGPASQPPASVVEEQPVQSVQRPRPVRLERPSSRSEEPNIQTLERPASGPATRPNDLGRRAARFFARAIRAGRSGQQSSTAWFARYLPRLLPGDENTSTLNWMPLMSIVIPLLVVTMALVIYFDEGQRQEYEYNYKLAVETYMSMTTSKVQNPVEMRPKLEAVLNALDHAEAFEQTEESALLRKRAQTALDALDRVVRMDFRPAIDVPFSKTVYVKHMVASDSDLYMLNETDGSVLRAVWNGQSFTLTDFNCKPGSYQGIIVGKLVDIIALPRAGDATLLGIDSSGNLLYCIPDEAPRVASLAVPDLGWNAISAITYDAGSLYVMDAKNKAVWMYSGTPDAQFKNQPGFFFGNDIPDTTNAVGIAVNGDDLYILHRDGHLTICTFSRISVSPTRCNNPVIYVDTRPGHQSTTTVSDGVFTQVQFTSPPDPAVVFLAPVTRSIYRFSPLSMELQNLIRSKAGREDPLPEKAEITAMAFSPNKFLFVFVGNRVFFTQMNLP